MVRKGMIKPKDLYPGMAVKISNTQSIYEIYTDMAKRLKASQDKWAYGKDISPNEIDDIFEIIAFKRHPYLKDHNKFCVLITNGKSEYIWDNAGIEAIDGLTGIKFIPKIPALKDLINNAPKQI